MVAIGRRLFAKREVVPQGPTGLASAPGQPDNLPAPDFSSPLAALKKELANRRPLPPKADQKLTVFLELEGVLFHTYVPHKTEAYFNKPVRPMDFEFDVTIGDENVPVMLYLRPNWQAFLDYLRVNCETVIYTSLQDYYLQKAMEVIGRKQFDFIAANYSQEDCGVLKSEFDGLEELSKVLEGLGRDPKRSVLVDHNALNFLAQPANSIPVLEYDPSTDQKQSDPSLGQVIETLREISGEEDVRTRLDAKFALAKIVSELNSA